MNTDVSLQALDVLAGEVELLALGKLAGEVTQLADVRRLAAECDRALARRRTKRRATGRKAAPRSATTERALAPHEPGYAAQQKRWYADWQRQNEQRFSSGPWGQKYEMKG